MNATAFALAGYIGWMLVLLGVLAVLRVSVTVLKGKPANSFKPDGTDVSPFSVRVVRAHANCYESFPFIGGALLLALATNNTAITNPLALAVLASRIAQSSIHLVSTSVVAVQLRFAFFVFQVAIAAYWVIQFLERSATGRLAG